MEKNHLKYSAILALLFSTALAPAELSAQSPSIFVGPQISLSGLGASVEADFGTLSVSGEFGYVPVSSIAFTEDDIDFLIDTKFFNGIVLANVGPGSGKFSLGAGLFIGGYNADGFAEDLSGNIELGNNEYDSADIGELGADLEYGGIAPAVMIGLRGAGFNIGIGAAFTGSAQFKLKASGPIQSNPQFVADLELEQEEIQDALDVLPVVPLLRIGWQFGVSN